MKGQSAWQNGATWARCKRKLRHRNKRIATKVAMEQSYRFLELLIAYECPDCGYWHTGHADQTQLAAHADIVKHLERMKRRKSREERGKVVPSTQRVLTGFCAAEDRRKDIRGQEKLGIELVYCSKACSRRAARHRANVRKYGTIHRCSLRRV